MIDENLLYVLELGALAVLIAGGVWYSYRTRQSTKTDASGPPAYDMRRDGQRPGIQTDP